MLVKTGIITFLIFEYFRIVLKVVHCIKLYRKQYQGKVKMFRKYSCRVHATTFPFR